jgi:hypothetical protein
MSGLQCVSKEPDLGDGVVDVARVDHGETIVERDPSERDLLRPRIRHADAVKPVSSANSRSAPASGSSLGATPFRDLPRVFLERVSELADEQDPSVLRDGDDSHRPISMPHDAVDAVGPVGTNDLVVHDLDPGVLVDGAP